MKSLLSSLFDTQLMDHMAVQPEEKMRNIQKDITLTAGGSPQGFRLTKPDAFSGVEILRLLLRLQGEPPATAGGGCFAGGEVNRISADARGARDGIPSAVRVRNLTPQCGVAPTEVAEAAGAERSYTVLDLITSLSSDELRSVMTSCLNHTEVLLPAGPHPVMTGSEWGYPELKHDTVSCMKLVLEEITWALEGFFGGGGPDSLPADATTSRSSARTSTSSSSSR